MSPFSTGVLLGTGFPHQVRTSRRMPETSGRTDVTRIPNVDGFGRSLHSDAVSKVHASEGST